MARHTRKGRNPGPVDEWLDTLGYYRKNVAYDETCLFRAVSEQMYACQMFHEKIRMECIAYGREHHHEFQDMVPKKGDWDHYLERLKKHMAVCGTTEIKIISKTYKKGVLLFDGLTRCMKEVTQAVYSDYLLLCHMGEDHYDVVYKREYIQQAGFCQSIIYKLLYENVFEIPKVNNIVQTMLYQKPPFSLNAESCEMANTNVKITEVDADDNNNLEISNFMKAEESGDKHLNDYEYMLRTNIPPFPFKVAKTLDPTIYRNIEYDTWTEMRKEMRLGEWYYGDNNLIQGTGCVYRDNNEEMKCYIQEILKDGKCVIYVTARAEKRTVKLCELRPEEDAKPWPLPYRFSKNLVLSIPKIDLPEKKNSRKKRDKKRTNSNNSETGGENSEGTVNAYEGAPLQMQLEASSTFDQETDTKENTTNQNITTYNYSEYSWDENAAVVQQTPESIIWTAGPSTPQSVFTFNPKPIIPTTPEMYTDARYFYTNDTYGRYVWTNGEYVAPLPSADQIVPPSPHGTEMTQSPDFNYYFSDGSYSPACYTQSNDGKTYATTILPQTSPQVEVYQPLYPVPPPGTPVILTSDMGEIVHCTPQPAHMIYSPAIEVPFIQTPPYIYPPTPPAAWYPSGINSQGFIFPSVNSQSNQSSTNN